MRPIALLALVLTALVSCRWQDIEPRVVSVGDPDLAYRAAMAAVQSTGHSIVEYDAERRYLRVMSKLDQKPYYQRPADAPPPPANTLDYDHMSWIRFQAQPDGSLQLAGTGYHIKESKGQIHTEFVEEMDKLVRRVEYYARTLGQQPAAAPAAATAP